MKKSFNYFSKSEIILWICEVILIITFFCIFDRKGFLSLAASLIGVTALIFCAKGLSEIIMEQERYSEFAAVKNAQVYEVDVEALLYCGEGFAATLQSMSKYLAQ